METWPLSTLAVYGPAALLALGPAVYGLVRADNPTTRAFTATMFVILGWILTDFLERVVPDPATKLWWHNACYLFIGTLPVFWFVLVLRLVGRDAILTRSVWWALWIIPLVFNLGAWTNGWHHALGGDPVPVNTPFSQVLIATRGPLYVLFYTYACVLNLCSLALLAWACRHREPLFLRQFVGFLVGEAAVLVPNLLYMLRIPPFVDFDLTSLALGVASFSIAWGVFRFRGFDATPVARATLLDQLDLALVVVDHQQRILDFNRFAAEAFSLAPTSLGRRIAAEASLPEALRDYLREGRTGPTPLVVGDRWFDAAGTWVPGSRGPVFGATLVDVTQKHQAQVRLAAQQQALLVLTERERLARNLHDSLGQQLGFLSLKAETLGRLVQGTAGAEGLVQMGLVAREANEELRSFLTETLPSRGEGTLWAQIGDLADRFHRLWGFAVVLEIPGSSEDEGLSPSQRSQAVKIVLEALHNARKHSGAGRVVVSGKRDPQGLSVAITDQGRGFSASPGGPDSWGLAIMDDRARQLGAILEVQSAPGQGTRVTLTCPPGNVPEVRAEGTAGVRVVLADDNALYAEGLAGLLTSGGYVVVGMAQDGDQALEMILRLRPEVALLDIQMPGKDGLEVARELLVQAPEVRVLLLTVSTTEDHLYQALRWGASGYLLKSKVTSADLFEALDGLGRGETVFTAAMAARILAELPPEPSEAFDLLTPRQRQVLELVEEGLTYKEIGAQIHLSEPTIKYHMGEILRRLQLSSRAEAERFVRQARKEPPAPVTGSRVPGTGS